MLAGRGPEQPSTSFSNFISRFLFIFHLVFDSSFPTPQILQNFKAYFLFMVHWTGGQRDQTCNCMIHIEVDSHLQT